MNTKHKVKSIQPNIDNYNDVFNIYINITDRCNLNCAYCYRNLETKKSIREIPYNIIKKFINNLKINNTNITILGGEPLLYRDLDLLLNSFDINYLEDYNINFIILSNLSIIISENLIQASLRLKDKIEYIGSFHYNQLINNKNIFINNCKQLISNKIKCNFRIMVTPDIFDDCLLLLNEFHEIFKNDIYRFTLMPVFSVDDYYIDENTYNEMLAKIININNNLNNIYKVEFVDSTIKYMNKLNIRHDIDIKNLYCKVYRSITINTDLSYSYSCPAVNKNFKHILISKNIIDEINNNINNKILCPYNTYYCGDCLLNKLSDEE